MNYLITAVRRNTSGTRIESYWVRPLNGTSVGSDSLWSFAQVATAILRGDTFTTAVMSARSYQWFEGAVVDLVLRSRADATAADNLENLPEK